MEAASFRIHTFMDANKMLKLSLFFFVQVFFFLLSTTKCTDFSVQNHVGRV